MAVKGPKTYGGINAKSGKSSQSDFDALLNMLSDGEEPVELFDGAPSTPQIVEGVTNGQIAAQMEALNPQGNVAEEQVVPQNTQPQPQPQPVPQPFQSRPDDIILGKRNFKIDPTKPFNQQQKRKQTNLEFISAEIKEDKAEEPQQAPQEVKLDMNKEDIDEQPRRVLNTQKEDYIEPEQSTRTAPAAAPAGQRRTLVPSGAGNANGQSQERRTLRPSTPAKQVEKDPLDDEDEFEEAPARKLGRKDKKTQAKAKTKAKKEKQPKAAKAKKEKQPKFKKNSRRQVDDVDIDESENLMSAEPILEDSPRGKKGKKSSSKAAKSTKGAKKASGIDPDKLKRKGFPKKYYDPTDREVDPESGEEGYFFNIEKTLRKHNMLAITKIIPLNFLDRMTYDKPFFDAYAVKQHESTVRLNSSTPEEQYKHESRSRAIKILAAAVVIILFSLNMMFNVIPNKKYNSALNYYKAENWETAYTSLSALGDYKNAKFYSKYAEAMLEKEEKKYDEAKEDFTLLIDYQEYFTDSIEERVNECDYLKAIAVYSSGDFETAMTMFAKIPEYSDATKYYYKCGYQIADRCYESGDLIKAIDSFYKVRVYEDANKRLSDIASQLYTLSMNDYTAGKYEDAAKSFKFLAKYNYRDSKSMIEQCTYRDGLNKYNDGDYEAARKLFSTILTYKDSKSLYKDCTYNIAKIKYADSIESSLKEFSTIPEFRDVDNILSESVFCIFGEWTLTEMNGTKTTPIDFKFNTGGLFQSKKQIPYTAISTDASPFPYKWDGEKYVTADGNYSLSGYIDDDGNLMLTCSEPDKTAEFKCVRKADYLTMLYNNENEGKVIYTEEDDPQESLNSAITNILQTYVDKKLDGKVSMNGREYNALLIIQQINEKIGS